MAIDVIVRGKVPEEERYEVYCEHCRSLLRCKHSDLSFTCDGRNGTDVSIICPVCERVQFLLHPLVTYKIQSPWPTTR